MASDIRPVFALPAADLIRERLATAIRNRTPLAADPETNAYRLVHGEGDGLPHLFIDRFADGVVDQVDDLLVEPFLVILDRHFINGANVEGGNHRVLAHVAEERNLLALG